MKKGIIVLFTLILILSCSKEDDNPSIFVVADDLSVIMDENPLANDVIGKVKASTNEGILEYSIISQEPEGAFKINSSTGELTVDNESLFNYETNPIIHGEIEVSNGELFDMAEVNIKLENVMELDEFQLSKFEEHYIDTEGNLQGVYESNFEDGKIKSRFAYGSNGTVKSEIKYYYDNDLLQKEEGYGNGVLQNEKTIDYDSSGRIVKVTYHFIEKPHNNYTDEFSFPDENTILASTTNSNNYVFKKKYFLDDNGLVIEEFQEDVITAVEYDNFNPILKVDQVSNIYYSYVDNSVNPLVIYHQILGDKKFNFVLYRNDLDSASDIYAEKLIKDKDYQNEESFKEINEYELNQVGLPISSKKFYEEDGDKRISGEFYYYYD